MRYRSKIGRELIILPCISLAPVLIISAKSGDWSVLYILIPVYTFIIYMFADTWYDISNGMLKVKSGFIYNKSIDIKTITKVAPTSNPISAPATSLDRIEVFFGTAGRVIISPKDKAGFIRHLQEVNPEIEYTAK